MQAHTLLSFFHIHTSSHVKSLRSCLFRTRARTKLYLHYNLTTICWHIKIIWHYDLSNGLSGLCWRRTSPLSSSSPSALVKALRFILRSQSSLVARKPARVASKQSSVVVVNKIVVFVDNKSRERVWARCLFVRRRRRRCLLVTEPTRRARDFLPPARKAGPFPRHRPRVPRIPTVPRNLERSRDQTQSWTKKLFFGVRQPSERFREVHLFSPLYESYEHDCAVVNCFILKQRTKEMSQRLRDLVAC